MYRALIAVVLLAAGQTASAPVLFQNTLPLDQMTGKQAVVTTSAGTFVIQLLPDAAPNHVGYFIKQAREHAYDGTIFHRVIRYGIIQGGDPLSKDPAKTTLYGTGGMGVLKAEINSERHTAGTVSAVLAPGKRDSAGAQFFVCVTDQPALDGQYTVFGRVVDGIEVVQRISATDADAEGRPTSRIVIESVSIRDTPPELFVHDSAADLATYHVTLETTKGPIELEMLPDRAPETVRSFLRLTDAGVYDGIGVHRVAPNFVIQTGALAFRDKPLTDRQQKLVHNLAPEFSDTPNVPGIVSMARGDDPGSGSTSFFICIGECRSLDGKYTAFAKVVSGMETVNAIAAVAVDGETPKAPIAVTRARVTRR
jgi:cyclophilin family peptidyl-prolyl cis-trans isomerase